jgi:NO-binding membrane sensor protein with MHYT domain
MQGIYDPVLVGLSYVISVFGAYTGLVLVAQLRQAQQSHWLWLGGAAVALGGGAIWSMHFIAMIAFKMDMAVSYDVWLTLASLVVAIAVTGLGLFLANRGGELKLGNLVVAGTLMGLGVAGMHYTGMEAMRMEATMEYDQAMVALSVAIAIVASTVALWLALTLRAGWQQFVAALVMGAAVCGMHYTAMLGTRFVHQEGAVAYFGGALIGGDIASYVAAATAGILGLALATAFGRELSEAREGR